MLVATLVALVVVEVAADISGDGVFRLFLAAFLAIGIARVIANVAYIRSPQNPADRVATRRWELAALAGAWGFAAVVGLSGGYASLKHAGTPAEFLVGCCVIAYVAGISSRNASRPLITVGQISATCFPFVGALVLAGDLVHLALGAMICALYASTIVMCRKVYDTIVSRHRAQAKLERLALRDPLTGLLNRSAFFERLEQALGSLDPSRCLGLLAIDLDRFKDVNDTLGHPAGDKVLLETAERLRTILGAEDCISRIGGDEFLVLAEADTPAGIAATAQRVADCLGKPILLDLTRVTCGASIGYAVAPRDGSYLDELMRHADLALYAAKRRSAGSVVGYEAQFSAVYHERMELLADLQVAMEENQFELVYQPIVNPSDGRTVCCEALLRWNHPRRGVIPPSVFIPLAEATGLIVPIGAWVIREACREATFWRSDINVAVNLSPVQFKDGEALIETVLQCLAATGLAAYRLELEVTESVLIEDAEEALSLISALRRQQIGVALDDFGTGFSSLGYLHEFPFSKLKLDRVFSRNLVGSRRSAAIVRGVVQITRDLRMELVAEGIETAEQLDSASRLGVNAVQGYLFSRPLSAERLRETINAPIQPTSRPPRRSGAVNAHSAA
ncbi:hypothetical protein ABB55_22395 [Prosthecomicrobium hirschii]|uniref:Diguanylate cyclase n=3 Tax=Prosthecodimorpha hirschii TaxID=665126 RepID=A0A0P6VSC2_9HYPH|nr:hypothetical protein ABB55_22395 [Prosthecomicrobium hirschii]